MPRIHYKPELTQNRKDLRNFGTPAEATLWNHLKNRQLDGRKFRRQHSVGSYILDFFCPTENLAIELDGAHHYTGLGQESDQIRDEFLNSLEIKVLRFENKEIFKDMDQVLERIRLGFKSAP